MLWKLHAQFNVLWIRSSQAYTSCLNWKSLHIRCIAFPSVADVKRYYMVLVNTLLRPVGYWVANSITTLKSPNVVCFFGVELIFRVCPLRKAHWPQFWGKAGKVFYRTSSSNLFNQEEYLRQRANALSCWDPPSSPKLCWIRANVNSYGKFKSL